jgi:hypothetical protein
MSTSPDALFSVQPSDYGTTPPFSLQDYGALSNTGLDAPTLDSPMGTDPFTGLSLYDGDPSQPSLTALPADASGGGNLYNDGLLPLSNPNPVSDKVIAQSQYSGVSFSPDVNLPLTPANTAIETQLGSPTTVKPVANAMPMGASLWADLFGVTGLLSGAKAGSAGAQASSSKSGGVTGVKAAPKTALSNPISGTTTALVIGVVAALIGMILWSFSGAR